ncbi:MAG: AI-2E family transporter [Bryobacterales bacterium]|nr:AI-2E family transporter [Bryobacterales bacterium]
MLGIEPKAVRATWSALVTVGFFAFLYYTRRTILVFLLAVFFAYLLWPVVSRVDRFARGRISRALSLAMVYTALIAALGGVAAAVGSRASEEAANLVARMPDLLQSAGRLSKAPAPPWLEPVRGQVLEAIQEQVAAGLESALPMLRAAMKQVIGAIGNLGFVVLVPILSFFFLKDAAELRQQALSLVNRAEEGFVEGLLDDVHRMLAQYIRALFLLSMATFLAYLLFFQLAGVPYAALLATIAAVLEFIPVIGPLTAGTAACVVALVSGYGHVGSMIVFLLLYRLLQDYVIQPFLLGSGLKLHPLLIVFGALAGEQLAGIAGMIFSVPVLATLRIVYIRAARAAS